MKKYNENSKNIDSIYKNSKEEINRNVHRAIWYMLIFSAVGLIIETIFCFITTGVIESRKGLILGPFCPIYGLGATILLILLEKYKNNKVKLFVYGSILGGLIEYITSFLLEAIYTVRFWNYTQYLNINGRVCLLYIVFWGILSVILVRYLKGIIDKPIDKIQGKTRKIIDIILISILSVDIIVTMWGTYLYKNRAKQIYDEVKVFDEPNIIEKVGNNLFPNELMVKIFPNMRFVDDQGEEVLIRDIINPNK